MTHFDRGCPYPFDQCKCTDELLQGDRYRPDATGSGTDRPDSGSTPRPLQHPYITSSKRAQKPRSDIEKRAK